MDKLLNKIVSSTHSRNIDNEPIELSKPKQVQVLSHRQFNEEYVIVNGGWLVPIEEINRVLLE